LGCPSGLVCSKVVEWLDKVRHKQIKLEESTHFSIVYASYVAGYASELLNENASSKHQHASKRIRKLRDYHLSIFRIVGELVRVSRTDTFILSIREVVSRPPCSLVLNGADTLSIIFRWAVDRRYDELYCRKIGKKFSPS
jgi:hypothetical protein